MLLRGRDVLGQAQTGTGKTAAFGVPLLMSVDTKNPHIQAVVLAPTRELAEQVAKMLRSYARYTDINVALIHGGGRVSDQINILRSSKHVVVGTPGRVLDLARKHDALDLKHVKFVVLDEADKMLEMGFRQTIEAILGRLPFVRQTSMWSATLSREVLEVSTRYMRHPVKIMVSWQEIAQLKVNQHVINVDPEDKEDALYRLMNTLDSDMCIIFLNTRDGVDELAQQIQEQGYLAQPLHGGFLQPQREETVRDFKLRKFKYLVSTDIVGRGIDILGVSHIINYEVPEDPEVYFHRIGRTGRKDMEGSAYTLMTPEDEPLWERIREMTESEVEYLEEI